MLDWFFQFFCVTLHLYGWHLDACTTDQAHWPVCSIFNTRSTRIIPVTVTYFFDVQEIFGSKRDDAASVNRSVILQWTVVGDVRPHRKRHRLQLFTDTTQFDVHCVSKKFPPLKSLWLCQILTDFQNVCTAGKRMKCATKLYDIIYLTLSMLLHYLGKLQIQIFCRHSVDMEENANKLHFNCL